MSLRLLFDGHRPLWCPYRSDFASMSFMSGLGIRLLNSALDGSFFILFDHVFFFLVPRVWWL